MRDLTPRQVVEELDRYIVGQADAKRAVAIAVRNRWRRQQLPDELREEVAPKNIIMIGPTGVGKTEIARRLAGLTGAPFIKVEATKYTEVGYYGRDVESMVRDLTEAAIGMVRQQERAAVEEKARERVVERLLDLLVPPPPTRRPTRRPRVVAGVLEIPAAPRRPREEPTAASSPLPPAERGRSSSTPLSSGERGRPSSTPLPSGERGRGEGEGEGEAEHAREPGTAAGPAGGTDGDADAETERYRRTREKMRAMLEAGELEDRMVRLTLEQKAMPVHVLSNLGMEQMDIDFQSMFEKLVPRQRRERELPVREARSVLFDEEVENLIDREKVQQEAIKLAENAGIIFVDELDKICGREATHGPDVSRQGVQRDLLPIVEGTTVQTRYGPVKTDHVLFIAAGAFHGSKPADLMPELQGRFPIRVELEDLTRDDFVRILTEPKNALTRQYSALLGTEGLQIEFTPDAVEAMADFAYRVNQQTQNIGARRLHTIVEKLVETISFDAPDMKDKHVKIDAAYVNERLKDIAQDEDLSRFIL